MPVSHLGLTVSHIPSATSFYLAALQPLGYRYIGQQGDSIGLGITDADFFLCQEQQNGTRVSPTHIAFTADNRLAVRHCYAAALNAGGRPSGAPTYRNGDCDCFNAAVEDLDGNTIEFIFRGVDDSHEHPEFAPSAASRPRRSQTWTESRTRSDDGHPLASKRSQAKSRAQTAMEVASTASKSMKKPPTPTSSITRSRTEPLAPRENGSNKTFVGTLLGAAAGAAVVYAMCQSERGNAREEEASSFKATARPRTNYETEKMKSAVGNKSHRNYSMTDSTPASRFRRRNYSPHKPSHHHQRSILAIESRKHDDDDSRSTPSSRHHHHPPQRSRPLEYAPKSTSRSDHLPRDTKHSTTHYYLEAPTTSRNRPTKPPSRHDSGISMPTAAQYPLPPSSCRSSETVVPEDSISCILSQSSKKVRSSARTVPGRKDNNRKGRSYFSHV